MHDYMKLNCRCVWCYLFSRQAAPFPYLFLIFFLLLGVGSFSVGYSVGRDGVRREAIEHGVATEEPLRFHGGFQWKKEKREY